MTPAASYVQKTLGSKVQTTFKENVPEGPQTAQVIDSLVRDGNKIIFATSFGYQDAMVAAAKKYPDVKFEQATGYKTSKNLAEYYGAGEDAIYLSGMAAGAATKKGVVGYVVPVRDPRGHPAHERVRARRAGDAPRRHGQDRVDEVVARARQGEEGRGEPPHLGWRRRDRPERRLARGGPVLGERRHPVGRLRLRRASRSRPSRGSRPRSTTGARTTSSEIKAAMAGTWKTGSYWGNFNDKFIDARAVRRRRLGQDEGRHHREDGRDQERLVLRVPGPASTTRRASSACPRARS